MTKVSGLNKDWKEVRDSVLPISGGVCSRQKKEPRQWLSHESAQETSKNSSGLTSLLWWGQVRVGGAGGDDMRQVTRTMSGKAL